MGWRVTVCTARNPQLSALAAEEEVVPGGINLPQSKRRPGWLVLAIGLPLVWLGFRWSFGGPLSQTSPWLAVPLAFVSLQWLGDALLAVLLNRTDSLLTTMTSIKTGLFMLLGLLAVPLLDWAMVFAGTNVSPFWPATAAYLTYTFWEPVG